MLRTDGIINDMDNTINQIIQAAHLPLSILIVGIGDADFTAMEVLVRLTMFRTAVSSYFDGCLPL